MAKRKSRPVIARMDKWEVANAADTLVRAEEIKSNKRLLSSAKRELTKRQTALKKVVKKIK